MSTSLYAQSQAEASSRRIEEILAAIDDEALRADVDQVVRLCFTALGHLRRIHLPQDHFEEGEETRERGDRHLDLAPYVLGAVSSINQLLGHVANAFPNPGHAVDPGADDDFDLEFDLVDGPTGDGVGLSHRSDSSAAWSPREKAADALNAFAGMLRSRVLDFAGRLRFALQQADGWPLLAELDEAQHRLTKAVQAVLFGVLGVFAQDVRREEILPAYRSAISESVALRAAFTDLAFHLGRFNQAIQDATPEAAVPLVVGIADRLARFASRPEYRTLRAEDKKAVIDFRATLHALRYRKEGPAMLPLRHAVEGFSKFLDAMHAINHREVLLLHDRTLLSDLLEHLDELIASPELRAATAAEELQRAVEILAATTGRSPDLDQARRDYFNDPPEEARAVGELVRWRGLVQGALAICS